MESQGKNAGPSGGKDPGRASGTKEDHTPRQDATARTSAAVADAGEPSSGGDQRDRSLDDYAALIDSVREEYGPGPESNHSHTPTNPMNAFDWYDEMSEELDDEWQDTIGLFGGRRGDEDRYNLTRRNRHRRIRQIVGIVRKYDIFHGLTPVSLRHMLEELGPTFVKAGQILSMRSEILPEPFLRELSKLRTSVEPMDREVVLQTLRNEYKTPIEDIFDAIDDVPLGSASVAQVHKARLITGELVAIKVQRPGVQEVMAQDIDIIRSMAKYVSKMMGDTAFVDLQSVVEELWTSFREETDFLVEARSLAEFRRNNSDCVFVDCPKPYLRLCTEHVVVMDYVQGIPISNTKKLKEAGYDLEEIGTKLVDNYTQQMLDDGFFHADPHPGNIIISGGKIVFIDLGIMGRLSAHDRQALSDIVFAVGVRDIPRLKDALIRFSVNPDMAKINHPQLLADLDAIVDNYGTSDLSDLNLGAFVNAIFSLARRDDIELPSSATMLARSLVTLEGVVDEFLPGISMVQILSNHLKSHRRWGDMAKREAKALARESHAATHGLLGAASQANLAMGMLTRGQLHMNLDLPGTNDPIADFSHAFDRLTMGIVIAGLFIGSSVIYYANVKPVIFGIPILGFMGFLIATFLGLWVVISIMREGRKNRGK